MVFIFLAYFTLYNGLQLQFNLEKPLTCSQKNKVLFL